MGQTRRADAPGRPLDTNLAGTAKNSNPHGTPRRRLLVVCDSLHIRNVELSAELGVDAAICGQWGVRARRPDEPAGDSIDELCAGCAQGFVSRMTPTHLVAGTVAESALERCEDIARRHDAQARAERAAAAQAALDRLNSHPACDSCKLPLTADDAGRYRHVSCPAPALPSPVVEILAEMRAGRGR